MDANSRDGEQSMNCIFYPDSGSVRTGQMNGIVWCVYVTLRIFHRIITWFVMLSHETYANGFNIYVVVGD